jgi:hypothetical protein
MKLSIASLVALATVSLAPAQDGKKLTINPKPGEVAMYRSTSTQVQNIEMMGQETTNETVTEIELKIDEVKPDGTIHATGTWKRVAGTLGTPMGEVKFDTSKNDDSGDGPLAGVADAFHALTKNKQRIVFDAMGEVKEMPDLKAAIDAAGEHLEGTTKMMMQGMFAEGAVKQQFGVFANFGAEAVKPGSTWTRKRNVGGSGGMNMAFETKHKLVEAGKDGYTMSVTGTVAKAKPDAKAEKGDDAEGDDDGQAQMMRKMMEQATISNGKLEGTQTAALDGLLKSSTSTMAMDIEMPNPMGGDEPFVVKVKTTTKLERITATAAVETKPKTPAEAKK